MLNPLQTTAPLCTCPGFCEKDTVASTRWQDARMTQRQTTPPAERQVWAVAAVVWLLVELMRGWTPLLITVFGRAAETPPELIGLFALAVTALPLVVLGVAAQRLASGSAVPVLVLAALLARLLLPLLSGRLLLAAASVGVVLALLALALTAARLGRALAPGLFTGLAAAATTHAALGTWGAVHRTDVAGAVVTALLVATVVTTLRGHRDGAPAAAFLRLAWVVLPVVLVAGIALANPARGLVAGSVGAMAVVAATAAAALLARRPWSLAHRAVAGVVVVAATAASMLREPLDWVVLVALLVGMPALAVLLGGGRAGGASPTRVARAVGSSAIVFTVLLFAFYAGYDMGYRADWVVVAVAVVVVAVALLPPTPAPVIGAGLALPSRAVTVVVVAALVAGVGPFLTVRALDDSKPPTAGSVRVAAWNLRMGYGMDGTFRPAEVAQVLREEGTDVVLLSEIDRGWLLNGGQDQLGVLARLLGFEMAFGPAGDQVWGDAILSRWPLDDVRGERLPGYDSLTGATALSATVTPPKGSKVRVVATHLQPDSEGEDPTLRQARDVAAIAKGVTGPVVVGGDFNFQPGSGSWQAMLDAGLTDALAEARPLRTARSDELTEEIDHVFVRGLTATAPRTLESLLSDHLPVFVDLRVD